MRTPNPLAYPPYLQRIEADLIKVRRERAGVDSSRQDDQIGFGLSGGGIRSATFSLGLLQALAEAKLLRQIDFLSTVSGGGYVGSFLGRLFTRDWITSADDVEQVILGLTPSHADPGIGQRVFRWLRDNGRYLAPRGSGDLLLLAGTALRNWVAVQVVLITLVLAVIVLLQILRGGLDWGLHRAGIAQAVTGVLCSLPGADSVLWFSPWLLVPVAALALWVVPTGWAYFLIWGGGSAQSAGIHPLWGAGLVLAGSYAGIFYYAGGDRPERLALCVVVAGLSTLTLAWLVAASWKAKKVRNVTALGSERNLISRWLTGGLKATALLAAWAVLDTVARTLYAVFADDQSSMAAWIGGVFAVLAGVGAFGRELITMIGSKRAGARQGLALSTIMWIAALGVSALWLVSIATASYAIVWRLEPLSGKPPGIGRTPPPTILGTERITVTPRAGGFEVTPEPPVAPPCTADTIELQQPVWGYVGFVFATLLLLSYIFGRTLPFANMSSMHAFYSARLTRTFLGASNFERLNPKVPVPPVTETMAGDDLDAKDYWCWPRASSDPGSVRPYPWLRGGPLHLLNVTVNETLDAKTGVQHQDRKGTGLAVGPVALSLGIRHHLVSHESPSRVFPENAGGAAHTHLHCVFSRDRFPEPLPLGRWVSVSGAAFSTAAGAQTTIPLALLAGLFNVRLGYWWDSAMPGSRPSWFAYLFPVQHALLSEAFARTRGTGDQLWNLSDGGHFENMGGYELIRRRLPVIVIVDAEADPDYTFAGLSDLVRKARLDFDAEVIFLNDAQLSEQLPVEGNSVPVVPKSVRPYFGNLDALRRGRWTDEPLPPSGGKEAKRYTLEVDRARVSKAHAALARVEYLDNGDASWLVYVKATLMGDEPEDVCHYHRAHPDFPQEPTTDQFFDEAQWESYRRVGLHIGHRVLKRDLFDHLRKHPAPRGEGRRR
jgi:hypothetical protein